MIDRDAPDAPARVESAEIFREYGPFPGAETVHGVTYDGRSIWFASNQLHAVSPATGAVERSIDVACSAGTAFDGRRLYQIAGDVIQKIDPESGRVIATIPAPGDGSSGMTWAEGALWVGQYSSRKIYKTNTRATARFWTTCANKPRCAS